MKSIKLLGVLSAILLLGCVWPSNGLAGDSGLAERQQQVTERYRRLEELLLRLADVEADENAERAALLRRAAKQSRDMFLLERLNTAGQSLRNEQFKNAIDNQTSAKDGLDRLLTLLLSEDRPQRIRDEKDRIGRLVKELKLVERLQKGTRARTENQADLEALGQEQQQIGDRAEKTREAMREDSEAADEAAREGDPPQPDEQAGEQQAGDEAGDGQPSGEQENGEQAGEQQQQSGEQQDGEQPPGDQPQSGDQETGEQQSGEQQSGEQQSGEQQSGEQQSGEQQSGEQQSGEQQSGEQQSGEQQSGEQQQTPQSPEQQAEQQLQEAIQKMRQAQQELERSQREDAVEQQRQAEEKLRAAIDRLEKILRQLREEEMQRELARLESRFRRMAQMQAKVLDDTKLLDAIPKSQRDRQFDVRSGNLAFEEKKIVMEADRAMLLLREEGSSVAFPEVVAQVRGDMQRVAERLTASKVDAVTLGIQEDILAALEEMIAALQQAQRDLEKQRQEESQQQQPGGEPGEQPLVEQIAELKLIRTMETRIMSTTERYSGMLDETGDVDEVLPLIRDLAERQNNLYRITRDIVQKRNR